MKMGLLLCFLYCWFGTFSSFFCKRGARGQQIRVEHWVSKSLTLGGGNAQAGGGKEKVSDN